MKPMHIGRAAVTALGIAFLAIVMTSGAAIAQDGLIGAWLQEGTIVPPHTSAPVFEFYKDGAVVYDTAGPRSHRGRYQIQGDRLIFAGWPPQMRLTYKIAGDDQLTITSVAPGLPGLPPTVVVTQWMRIPAAPLFAMASADRVLVPAHLNTLVAAELVFARHWQSDAIPTALSITIYGPGFYEIETDFQSRKAAKQLQDYVTAHFADARLSSIDPNDMAKPLPVDFIDFPKAFENARRYKMKGPLAKADLRVWGKNGPVWTVTGADGVTLSALTGANIEGDVSGYKAHYNAQWAKAIAGLKHLKNRDASCNVNTDLACFRAYIGRMDQDDVYCWNEDKEYDPVLGHCVQDYE